MLKKDNGKQCGMLVATKNPTNLKNHLRHHHHTEYEEIDKEEREIAESNAKRIKTNDEGTLILFINVITSLLVLYSAVTSLDFVSVVAW